MDEQRRERARRSGDGEAERVAFLATHRRQGDPIAGWLSQRLGLMALEHPWVAGAGSSCLAQALRGARAEEGGDWQLGWGARVSDQGTLVALAVGTDSGHVVMGVGATGMGVSGTPGALWRAWSPWRTDLKPATLARRFANWSRAASGELLQLGVDDVDAWLLDQPEQVPRSERPASEAQQRFIAGLKRRKQLSEDAFTELLMDEGWFRPAEELTGPWASVIIDALQELPDPGQPGSAPPPAGDADYVPLEVGPWTPARVLEREALIEQLAVDFGRSYRACVALDEWPHATQRQLDYVKALRERKGLDERGFAALLVDTLGSTNVQGPLEWLYAEQVSDVIDALEGWRPNQIPLSEG